MPAFAGMTKVGLLKLTSEAAHDIIVVPTCAVTKGA
jgi:hypothetical protein